MLELKDLRLSGIGRFVEEQSINFSSLSDFIQVDGQNNNTKGSSGSGKTTVFNALDYLLGLNDLPSTILQSRFTEEHISVSGDFLWDGKEVTITRGKKIEIKFLDKTIKGSSALAEEQIDQILGMPRKIFRKILHKRQKEGGFFLDFTPQKMYEFLTDCLDLSKYKAYDEIEEVKIKSLTLRKTTEETFLNGQEVGLEATREAILSLGPGPKKAISQEDILSLKKKVDEAESELTSVLAVHKLNQSQLERERPETSVVPFDRSIMEFHRKNIDDLGAKINALLQEEKDRLAKAREWMSLNDTLIKENDVLQSAMHSAHKEAIKAADEIKQIRANTCPTCKQQWSQGQDREAELIKHIADLKVIMDKGNAAHGDRYALDKNAESMKDLLVPKIDPQIPIINEHISETHAKYLKEKQKEDAWIDKQNVANKVENERFAHKQLALQQRQAAEANQARGQVDIASRVFDSAISMLKASSEARERYDANFADLKSKEEKFTKKIAEIKITISAIDADIGKAEETRRAIKTFLSYSFDDALEAIGNRSTEIIRCIPNTNNATIQFDGTKETKDGKVKEEVNAVIGMDGEESIPIKSLCGGERTSVDLAVDLAVIDFIETKSGKGINLFILDEPFTGLGPVEIEMALEVLKNSNTNKKIVIVDHNSEVKQMVQDRLVVVRNGLTSRIEKDANV